MDAKECASLYGRMVSSYRKEPLDSEQGAWASVLAEFSSADVDAACRRWKADTTIEEWNGKPIGARMPDAAELKLSIQRFQRKARESTPEYCGDTECQSGWRIKVGGLTHAKYAAGVNERLAHRCPACLALWQARKAAA
jgi:hypothetical protein